MSASGPPGAPTGTGAANPYSPPAASIDGAGSRVGVPAAAGPGGYNSATGLAKAIAVLMLVDVLIQLGLVVSGIVAVGVIREAAGDRQNLTAALRGIALRSAALGGLAFLALIAIVVLFCLFMARTNRNARAFGSPMSNTPGWAAGWFFIPVAFWWMPYLAMKEIWQGSDPDPAVHPWQSRVSPLVPCWWAAYLLRHLSGIASMLIGKGESPLAKMVTVYRSQLVLIWPSVAAALLAAAVVLAVARRQDERQRRHPAGTPLPAQAP